MGFGRLQGVGGVFERVDRGFGDLQPARFEERAQGRPLPNWVARIGVRAPARTEDRDIAQENAFNLDGGDLTAGEPENDERPLGARLRRLSVKQSPPTGSRMC
jgi:hypothetical protein